MTVNGIDLYGIQQNILTYLRGQFPTYTFHRGSILSDENLVRVNGKVQNYFVIRFSSLFESPSANGSMGGVRWDDFYGTFDLNAVGPNEDRCAQALNVVRDRLLGVRIDGSGAIRLGRGTGGYAILNLAGNPTAYFDSQRFEFNVNTNNVASFIPVV
jgi:hypothetical protein